MTTDSQSREDCPGRARRGRPRVDYPTMGETPHNGAQQDPGQPHGQHLSVPEAANILGIGRRRVTQLLERGELLGHKDPDSKRWKIPAHDLYDMLHRRQQEQQSTKPGPKPKPEQETSSPNPELVEALRSQVADLRAQLEQANEANRENRRLLAAALERIPQLEAPSEPSESPLTASEDPPKGTTPEDHTEPHKEASQPRSWWSRIFGTE